MQPRSMRIPCVALLCAMLAASRSPLAATGGVLFEAIRRNDTAAVKTVIDEGAAVEAADDAGSTPLMYAALYAGPGIIGQLIDHGARVNASNTYGATALMWAASRTENVKALLESGANVNARASNGWTALVAATRYGNTDAMRLLLAAGADTTSPETRGHVLTGSYFATNPAVRDVLRDARVVVTSSADLAGTVLDRTRDDITTLTRLLRLGVNPREEVPLITVTLPTFFMAARDGQVDAMRAFVAHGVDPTYKGARGWTALMVAASADRPSIATLQYLLEGGADVNATDDDGRTALDWALTRGETDVSAFLRKAGARTGAVPEAAPIPVSPRSPRDAIERAVARLQPAGPAFSDRTKCVSCHNQSIPGIAIAMAKVHGLRIDAGLAAHSVNVTEERWRKYRDAVLMGDTLSNVAFVPYGLLERVEAGLPPTLDTDAMVVGLASRQTMDGSWRSANHIRPPLNGSDFAATALAVRALRAFAPPGHRADMERRVARGREFLEKSEPDDTQDRVFKLLGLMWSGAPAHEIAKEKAALIALQRRDGGWGQMPTLDADAYATGQALYALHAAGMAPTATTYQKGADYLLRTQLDDGTWFVRTRAFGIQPYFETGFPHGRSQFISTTATAWAAIALAYTLD